MVSIVQSLALSDQKSCLISCIKCILYYTILLLSCNKFNRKSTMFFLYSASKVHKDTEASPPFTSLPSNITCHLFFSSSWHVFGVLQHLECTETLSLRYSHSFWGTATYSEIQSLLEMLPPPLSLCYSYEAQPLSMISSYSFSIQLLSLRCNHPPWGTGLFPEGQMSFLRCSHLPWGTDTLSSGITTTCEAQVNHLWYSHALTYIVTFLRTNSELQLSIFSFSLLSGSNVFWCLFFISWVFFLPKVFFHFHLRLPSCL